MASKVTYNYLGKSGLKVSNIALGTALFGNDPAAPLYARPTNLSEEQSQVILDHYAALGGNLIDTADVYQSGQSEQILGSWLQKQNRRKFIVMTKARFYPSTDQSDPNNVGLSRKHLLESIDNSLERLGTDHVDIYMTHGYDPGTPIEETVTALNDIVQSGKASYIGVSNISGWQLQKMIDVAKERRLAVPICLQAQYSLICRGIELEVAEVAKHESLGIMAWSPLKGGFFSGKLKSDMSSPPEGSRMAWASQDHVKYAAGSNPTWQQHATPKNMKVLKKVEEIAKQQGHTVPQIAVRWLLQKPYVPAVVVGSRTVDQLDGILEAATGWELNHEQMAELDEVSSLDLDYPYDMVKKLCIGR